MMADENKIGDAYDSGDQKKKQKDRMKGLYEDCEFYRVPKDGKKGFQTISVYRGLMYKANQTPRERCGYRIRFSLILAALFLLFAGCCMRPNPFNYIWYVGLSEGAMIVGFSYILVVWIIYLTAEREMRAYLYRMTSKRLIRACEITAIFSCICVAALLIYILASGFDSVVNALMSAACIALCGFGTRYLGKMEEAVPYMAWQSTEQPPANGEKLDYGPKNRK